MQLLEIPLPKLEALCQMELFHFWIEQTSQVWQDAVLFMKSLMVCVFFATVENISQQRKVNINAQLHNMQYSLDPLNTLLLTFLCLCDRQFLPWFLYDSLPGFLRLQQSEHNEVLGYQYSRLSEFLSGPLNFFAPCAPSSVFKPISCMSWKPLENCLLFWSQYANNLIQN